MHSRKAALKQVSSFLKESAEVTTTYSATMRRLRKDQPDKVLDFMKAFKKAFDQAIDEKLDDSESIALMEAIQMIE